jgi:uncharacterized membrane protein YesL
MTARPWAGRVHAACGTVAWCAALNAQWIAFSLLGGVVLGIGPATVTASILVRRRGRGETTAPQDFWRTYRREFGRGNAVMLPVVAVVALLAIQVAAEGRVVPIVALVLAVAGGAYVAPMYAHYDIPLWSYVVKSMRFALARPAPTALLLLVGSAIAFATVAMPILLLVISAGAWLHVSTWLALRFFAENEDRLHRVQTAETPLVNALPSEPLRIR